MSDDRLPLDGALMRTDLNCTHCDRPFVAQLDMSIDGNHVIECPYCGHEHCRVIDGGIVTDDRWSSRKQRINVERRCVWKAVNAPIVTSMASAFIREKWLAQLEPGS